MTKKIRRYLTPEEWSVEQHHQAVVAQNRGQEAPKFETPEYRAAVAEALADAGLDDADADADEADDDEQDDAPTTDAKLAAMSVEEHLNAIQGGHHE